MLGTCYLVAVERAWSLECSLKGWARFFARLVETCTRVIPLYGSSRIGMKQFQNNWENYLEIAEIPSNMAVGAVSYALETAKGDRGNKVFELSNHLGNVLATVSDKKLGRVLDSTSFVAAYYDGQVRSVQDYYAFGWNIPSRKFNTGSYRHGFNGKENDSDFGEQLIQDYGFRIYNPSVGRFLSVDPLTRGYPMLTPYQFASNRPVDGSDLDGLEWHKETDKAEIIHHVIEVKIMTSDNVVIDNELYVDYILAAQTMASVIFYGEDSDGNTHIATLKIVDEMNKSHATQEIYDNYVKNSLTVHFVSAKELGEKLERPNPDPDKGTILFGLTKTLNNVEENHFNVVVELGGHKLAPYDVGRTLVHEVLHGGGLRHPVDLKNVVPALKGMLMDVLIPYTDYGQKLENIDELKAKGLESLKTIHNNIMDSAALNQFLKRQLEKGVINEIPEAYRDVLKTSGGIEMIKEQRDRLNKNIPDAE